MWQIHSSFSTAEEEAPSPTFTATSTGVISVRVQSHPFPGTPCGVGSYAFVLNALP
jgi:hypothetical protein